MPHSGELLRLVTPLATLVVLGKDVDPIAGSSDAEMATFFPLGQAASVEPLERRPFYDDVPYQVQISAKDPVEVTLGDRPMNLQWVRHDTVAMATYSLTFHQVGWVELRIGDSGVRIPVSSRKLDYESDYQEMVRDLENQVRGLTARLVSHLVNPMNESEEAMDLWSYWLALLERLWSDLKRDLAHAWRTLPPQLRFEDHMVQVDRLRRPRGRDVVALSRGNPRLLSQIRQWEDLTAERLYLVQLAGDIHRRLNRIQAADPEMKENRRLTAIAQDIVGLVHALAKESGVERVLGIPVIPSSPIAQSHPALRRVIRWHRMLQRGLFPDGASFFVGQKNMSLLYEYWCYLKIVRILVDESGGTLEVEPMASVRPQDIVLGAGKGSAARVKLRNGRRVTITYQRLFTGLPTIGQQPDHVVELVGLGSLVFDAKYRFEIEPENQKWYGAGMPIPPVGTINSMHQYHDAIVLTGAPYTRLVDRAIVLFPLPRQHHAMWRAHRFYRSIDAVGVGAIPLLPTGTDEYLRSEIRRYLRGEVDHARDASMAKGPVQDGRL